MSKMILGVETEDNKFEYYGFEGCCTYDYTNASWDGGPSEHKITLDIDKFIILKDCKDILNFSYGGIDQMKYERRLEILRNNSHYGLRGRVLFDDLLATNIIDTYITKIIFNGPATIVFFRDGSKEVVKCSDMSKYDAEKGVLYAFMKHMLNSGNSKKTYNNNLKMIDSATLTEEQRRANDIFWNYGKSDTQEPKKDDNVVKEE